MIAATAECPERKTALGLPASDGKQGACAALTLAGMLSLRQAQMYCPMRYGKQSANVQDCQQYEHKYRAGSDDDHVRWVFATLQHCPASRPISSSESTMTASKDIGEFPKNFIKVFWTNQFRTTIPLPTRSTYPDLREKVIIVTGASTGLGLEAARQLIGLGLLHIVLAVRSLEKGEAAAAALAKVSPKATIEVWALEMESYESIEAFVRKCETDLHRIDGAILNAGISPLKFAKSSSTGHERTIQINHLSTALLAVLLLPVLKAKRSGNRPAILTIVNSVTAHLCKFSNREQRPLLPSFDDQTVTPWDPQDRYGTSKLLSQLFMVELAERVGREHVIINMVDPGLTKGTGLAREAKGVFKAGVWVFFHAAGRPVERGAATYVDAVLGHGSESHGCFLMNNNIAP